MWQLQPQEDPAGPRRRAHGDGRRHHQRVRRPRRREGPRRPGQGEPAGERAAAAGRRRPQGQRPRLAQPHRRPRRPRLPGEGEADGHRHRHPHRQRDGHGHGHRDGDGDPDQDADGDTHPDRDADRDADGDRDAHEPPRRGRRRLPRGRRVGMTDELFAHRYKLDRRLGVGGMATVQLAFDTRLERYVAVKLLAEHLAEDASFVSRFRREALAAARLVHPNIVQVFDFGSEQSSGRQFIVMEFVDGHSCAELLRDRGPMGPRDAVDVLAQACRGLDYAHRNGVVHRDVKPGNLLRNTDGVVKLADFGIAKAAEQSDITKVGSVLGTAAYLSPEQARGQPAGPASDLYALGVVSYQLLAGRLPYEAASLTDLARLQETSPPPRLDELNPDVPGPLAEAIMVALHRDPERRYADAADMEQALGDALQGRAPARDTESTWAMDDTDATQMLAGTQATTALP